MAIANKIDIKKSGIKNCFEFASTFMDIIDKQASGFQEVRVIFYRCDTDSLKTWLEKNVLSSLIMFIIRWLIPPESRI